MSFSLLSTGFCVVVLLAGCSAGAQEIPRESGEEQGVVWDFHSVEGGSLLGGQESAEAQEHGCTGEGKYACGQAPQTIQILPDGTHILEFPDGSITEERV